MRKYSRMDMNSYRSYASMIVSKVLLVLSCSCAQANDEVLVIEGTTIKGDQESPNILYVVPWQTPSIDGLESNLVLPQLQPDLEILERSEFKRLLGYHDHFSLGADKVRTQEKTGK